MEVMRLKLADWIEVSSNTPNPSLFLRKDYSFPIAKNNPISRSKSNPPFNNLRIEKVLTLLHSHPKFRTCKKMKQYQGK